VGPKLEAVVEPDQEVLADGLDAGDRRAHDTLDLRPASPNPGGRHGATHEMRGESGGSSVERVAVGYHQRATRRGSSRAGEGRGRGIRP
jgi:hypothetical protein